MHFVTYICDLCVNISSHLKSPRFTPDRDRDITGLHRRILHSALLGNVMFGLARDFVVLSAGFTLISVLIGATTSIASIPAVLVLACWMMIPYYVLIKDFRQSLPEDNWLNRMSLRASHVVTVLTCAYGDVIVGYLAFCETDPHRILGMILNPVIQSVGVLLAFILARVR